MQIYLPIAGYLSVKRVYLLLGLGGIVGVLYGMFASGRREFSDQTPLLFFIGIATQRWPWPQARTQIVGSVVFSAVWCILKRKDG